MFHQANVWRYDGVNSTFSDLGNAVLTNFRRLSSLPISGRSLSEIGQVVADRMSYNDSGVSATLSPGVSLTIRVSRNAKIPVTGICRGTCVDNGGQPISYFSANPLLPTLVLLP